MYNYYGDKMARRFYLSIVYDANGYDRFDILSNNSLKELDLIVSNFNNRDEIMEAYLSEYNIDKKKGRLCILYEDTIIKRRELDEYNSVDKEYKERLKKEFSYAHIIPIMYKNRRLMNLDECLIILKRKLHNKKIIDSIMYDKVKNGLLIKKNKKYIFETEEEKDLINNLCDYHEAISHFLKRINKASEEDIYFYCRTLLDICELSISTVKTKVGNINIRDGNLRKLKNIDFLSESDKLEIDANDMDSFYIKHDLDEVIRLSPDSKRPIGSERKKK